MAITLDEVAAIGIVIAHVLCFGLGAIVGRMR